MNSSAFYELSRIGTELISLVVLSLCVITAWWLYQSKVIGGRWMLWGMMLQGVRLLFMMYQKIRLMHLVVGSYTYNDVVELSAFVSLVANIGLLIFAIGLFLHAKHHRGLQARVEELERILDDVQGRR